jgi:hypothetical protein
MPITATDPTTIAATFDLWQMAYLTIAGDGLADFGAPVARPVVIESALVKYRTRADGVPERSPLPGDRTPILRATLAELLGDADLAPLVAAAEQAVVSLLVAFATKRGAI